MPRSKHNIVLTQDQLDKQARLEGRVRVVPPSMRDNYDRSEGYTPGEYMFKDKHPHRGRIDSTQYHFTYEDTRTTSKITEFE